MKQNYQVKLEQIIAELEENKGTVPTLLLHSCCAPCSSYVLEYLCKYFKITVFYYNPNIISKEEYQIRKNEQKRLIQLLNDEMSGYKINIIEGDYDKEKFYSRIKGYEGCKEGGERCKICFQLRLEETARIASGTYDYFGTTLTISPLKNAALINKLGEMIAQESETKWLYSDFKKKNGYLRSIELSKKYELYRQDFCGCIFSKRERLEQKP